MKKLLMVMILFSLCSAKDPDNVLKALFPSNGPGYQYVVVNSEGELFSQTGGYQDIAGADPMQFDNTMAALSMTKAITAIGILKLVDDGKASLDDAVLKYTEHPYDKNITIRDLILHTSGIPNPIPLKWVHPEQTNDTFDEKAEFDAVLLKYNEQKRSPGEKYAYSNIGYWLLGRVIEKASGIPFEVYIEQKILKPLNLDSTMGFTYPDPELQAKGYVKKWSVMGVLGPKMIDKTLVGNNEKGYIHIKNYYLNGPAFGGLIGNAKGFSRILQDILSDEPVIISATTRNSMFSPQLDKNGNLLPMVLGWHVGYVDNVRYLYKEGGAAGYRSEMRLYPEHGIGTVLMMNKTSFNFKKHMSKIDSNFLSNSGATNES